MPITIRLALASLGYACATTFPQKWKGKREHFSVENLFHYLMWMIFQKEKQKSSATFHESTEDRAQGGVEWGVG